MPSSVGPGPVSPDSRQYLVRMRDGVHLATDVYLPAAKAPTEAVLVRLSYDKNGRSCFMNQIAPHVTSRGYALVVQDVRGKFRSEGDCLAFVHESEDGFDTLDWLTNQHFCNGTVGMFGDSYHGFTAWAAVSSGHPALAAIAPRATTAALAALAGGASFRPRGATAPPWLAMADYFAHYWLDHLTHDFVIDYGDRPLCDVFERVFRGLGKRSASFDHFVSGESFDAFPAGHPFDARPVPVLHRMGWFDNLLIPQMGDYLELTRRSAWAPLQYLLVDSTDHHGYHLSLAPIPDSADHDTDDEALARLLPGYLGPVLDFFDVFLKGVRDVSSIPRVRWHVGHGGYRESDRWPPPSARQRLYYLTDLAGAAGGASGSLSELPPARQGAAAWVHDPRRPVPAATADSFSFLRDYPDEAAYGSRPGVLVFSASPVTSPVDLAGPVELRVRLRSTAPTTDLHARLLDVAPDGSARMIARGQSHVVAPSGGAPARVELGHTGYRLRRGHALRLHLASSEYPEYVPNSGSAEDPWRSHGTSSIQTLLTDPEEAASLSITALP